MTETDRQRGWLTPERSSSDVIFPEWVQHTLRFAGLKNETCSPRNNLLLHVSCFKHKATQFLERNAVNVVHQREAFESLGVISGYKQSSISLTDISGNSASDFGQGEMDQRSYLGIFRQNSNMQYILVFSMKWPKCLLLSQCHMWDTTNTY